MEGLQQFAAVVLVIALLLGAVWLLRANPHLRVGSLRRNRTTNLASIGHLTLTAHHSVHLVRVGKQVLVLGVCPGAMTLIRELDGDSELLPQERP
jgi:flagellar biogenesis protein FliO